MVHTIAPLARRNASRVVFLLGAPVALFWSLGMAFERLLAQRLPALTGGSRAGVSVAFFRSTLLGYFIAAPIVLLLGSLLAAGGRATGWAILAPRARDLLATLMVGARAGGADDGMAARAVVPEGVKTVCSPALSTGGMPLLAVVLAVVQGIGLGGGGHAQRVRRLLHHQGAAKLLDEGGGLPGGRLLMQPPACPGRPSTMRVAGGPGLRTTLRVVRNRDGELQELGDHLVRRTDRREVDRLLKLIDG